MNDFEIFPSETLTELAAKLLERTPLPVEFFLAAIRTCKLRENQKSLISFVFCIDSFYVFADGRRSCQRKAQMVKTVWES